MKGVTKKEDGRYIAQYWNKELAKTIYIGSYDTADEASHARAWHLTKLYDGLIDDSIPRVREYPKGISERHRKYRALIHIYHGYNNKKTSTIPIGTFDTVEEAVDARKEFILKLL